MNCPLLTIGIPTFNRAKLLGHTLESVLRQIPSELTNRVDILISDNASTDDTEAAVQAFGTKYPVRITYSRNTENIGYDRNVDRLFKKASGNYVWLLGDDDTLKDGAILHILDLLTQHPKLKAILVNFDAYDAQLEILQDQKEISRDFLCTNPEMFLSNAARSSYQQLLLRKGLEGLKVSRFMEANPITVSRALSIEHLVEDYIYKHAFKMFPVVDDGRLVGCVTMQKVKDIPRSEWAIRTVGEISGGCSADNSVAPNTDAMVALAHEQLEGRPHHAVNGTCTGVGPGINNHINERSLTILK